MCYLQITVWYMLWKAQRWMGSQSMWHKSPFDDETISFTAAYQICWRPEREEGGCSSCFPIGWNLGHNTHVVRPLFATLGTLDWQPSCFSGHTRTSVSGFSFPWETANTMRLQDTWKQRKLPLGKTCYGLTISFEFCLFLDLDFILDFSVCLLASKSRFNFLLCIVAYFVTGHASTYLQSYHTWKRGRTARSSSPE